MRMQEIGYLKSKNESGHFYQAFNKLTKHFQPRIDSCMENNM